MFIAEINEEQFIMDAPDEGPDPWVPGGINYARSMLEYMGYLAPGELAAVRETYGRATPCDIEEYLTKLLKGEVRKPKKGDEKANCKDIFMLVTYHRLHTLYRAERKATGYIKGTDSPGKRALTETASAFNRQFRENIGGDTVANELVKIRRRKPQGVLRAEVAG